MALLELRSLNKSFDETPILNNVDLSLEAGNFLAVLGPSGCGKSTLLRIIAGLEAQDSGEVWINGVHVDALPPKARDIAMVFQSYALYPHMSVEENIALPLVMRDLTRLERLPAVRRLDKRVLAKRADIRAAVRRAAALVDIEPLLERKPKQLSGGQRQRVALARAFVRQPRLFLLDEPLSNLDASLRTSTRTEIVELQRRMGVTTVYVTHDQTEAMTMADRIVIMMAGEIVQIGRAQEIYRHPADLRVAQFIGSPRMTILPGDLMNGLVRLAGGMVVAQASDPDQEISIGLRSEDVRLQSIPDASSLAGTIRHVEFLGAEAFVHLTFDRLSAVTPIIVRVPADVAENLSPDGKTNIVPDMKKAHLFGKDGKRLRSVARTATTDSSVTPMAERAVI